MITRQTWHNGLRSGVRTSWVLSKIIFPVTFIVTILQYTPLLGLIERLFEPIMKWFGLSGEAAISLALGFMLNLYAAIGAILSLDLTVKEVFILAIILSFSHSLFVETALCKRIGISGTVVVAVRLLLAFSSAIVIHLVWQGGGEPAQYGLIAPEKPIDPTWVIILYYGLKTAFMGILQLIMIVLPLMFGIQILKDLNILSKLARLLRPITRLLGVSERTSITLLAGLMFGLSFGAGVIIQQAEEGNFSKRDLYLLLIFLVGCHAVVEDTLIFLPLGINVIPLLVIRIFVAFMITVIVARLWERFAKSPGSEQLNEGRTS